MSMRGELGPELHALIKELARRRVNYSTELHSEESRRLAEGTEVSLLRRRFPSEHGIPMQTGAQPNFTKL